MSEKNIHPVSDAAARVSRFLLERKRYAGRERIMAVEGYELKTSDLEAMVEFIHSSKKETGAQTRNGVIPIPMDDTSFLTDDEHPVERYCTAWIRTDGARSS